MPPCVNDRVVMRHICQRIDKAAPVLYIFNMKYFPTVSLIWYLALFTGCYHIDYIRFEHENYGASANPYDDSVNYAISPSEYDGKAFLVAIKGTYDYASSLFWLKDKDLIMKMDVSIYSEGGIETILINSCEIIFEDFTVEFNDAELSNCITRTSTNHGSPYVRNYALFEKIIDKKTITDYIKNNNIERQFIAVNVDVQYEENGEVKNWVHTTKFYIRTGRVHYTPENL
jgi:hypothetical protein